MQAIAVALLGLLAPPLPLAEFRVVVESRYPVAIKIGELELEAGRIYRTDAEVVPLSIFYAEGDGITRKDFALSLEPGKRKTARVVITAEPNTYTCQRERLP